MEKISYNEHHSNPEKMSQKELKFWMANNPPYTQEEYIGTLYINNNEFVANGATEGDTKWLYQKLQQIWQPQAGIPVWKKNGNGFSKDKDGKYILGKFANHGNSTPDELLEAVYNYTKSMGVFKVELIDKI